MLNHITYFHCVLLSIFMMPKGECHRCTGVKKSSGAFRPQAGEKGSQAGEKIIGCIGLSGW